MLICAWQAVSQAEGHSQFLKAIDDKQESLGVTHELFDGGLRLRPAKVVSSISLTA